jgi:PiT family inorganic phosphate transporter
VITYSRPVMETVGKKLVRLDPYSALIVVVALAVTVHFYSFVGVPVSTSQAVIGGVLGIGLIKGVNTVSRRSLVSILVGWLLTPLLACVLAVMLYFITHLQYVPA